jgi:hypothetical protein
MKLVCGVNDCPNHIEVSKEEAAKMKNWRCIHHEGK